MNEMLRANLVERQKIILEEVAEPIPGPGQVRLEVETCGVCGSDIHAYYGEHPYIGFPIQPGHEFAGRIESVGPGVAGWRIGQRVTAEPSLICGECENCRNGKYHICYNLRVIGCQTDGAMAKYVLVPASKLVELPPDMTFEQGSFVEPLAVGVHALRRGSVTPDTRLLILGAGTIGLMTLLAARGMGVTEITMTDLLDDKLDMALELGARHTLNVGKTDLLDFCRAAYGRATAFDVAIECVGTHATVAGALPALKKGGKMVLAGVFPVEVMVNLGLVQDREIELIGTLMYQIDEFRVARDLIASGKAPVERLISARYPLDRLDAAMKAIDEHPERNLKTMIHIRPQSQGNLQDARP
jgi:L-iditol 2-dehydrogenase